MHEEPDTISEVGADGVSDRLRRAGFYDTFYMGGTLQQFVSKLTSVLAPVVYGAVIAYLLTPVMNWIERVLHAAWQKVFPKKHLKNAAGILRFSASCWRRRWPSC